MTVDLFDFYYDVTQEPEWRNWYTHQTQNLARFTPHESSSLSSGTKFRIANRITEDITIIQEQTSKQKISHVMDHITLDPIWGYVFFAVIMGLLYVAVFGSAAAPSTAYPEPVLEAQS